MRTAQTILAFVLIGAICGANLYLDLVSDWIAGVAAVTIAGCSCWLFQRAIANRAQRVLRKEFGEDWQ